MAIALQGAIIESQESGMMSYYKKCEFCGDVANSTTRTSAPLIGSFHTGSFTCRCGKNNQIKIRG